MASSEILKEFLVAIGYKHDDVTQKKVFDGVAKLEKGLFALSAAATTATIGIVAGLERMGKAFENAYYQSSRTGSSVKELNAFKYAAAQMGSSAEEAQSAVEGLARKMRENPGYGAWLKRLGATDPKDVVKSLNEFAPKLAAMPLHVAESYAKAFDIPDHLLLALRQIGDFRRLEAEAAKKYGILGFDPQQAAEDGRKLTMSFRNLYDSLAKIAERADSGLFKELQPQIEKLNNFLLAHGKQISDAFVKIGDALFKMFDWVVRHIPELDHFVDTIGGWTTAFTALAAVISANFVLRLAKMSSALSLMFSLTPPGWLLRLLSLSTLSDLSVPNAQKPGIISQWDDNAHGPAVNPDDISGPYRFRDFVPKGWFGGYGTGRAYSGRSLGGNEAIARRGHASANVHELVQAGRDQLIREGISPANAGAAAAALVGNVMQESGGNPDAVHDGGTGYGIYGAGRGRRDRMLAWLAANRYARNSVEGQMRYMAHEAMTDPTYKQTAEALRRASVANLGEVTNTVAVNFERPTPASAGYQNRRNNAAAALARAGQIDKVPVPRSLPPPQFQTNQYGGFNPDAMRSLFSPPPLGTGSADHSRHVSMNNSPSITISGVADPTQAAAMVGARMDKHASMTLRNLQSAIG